MTLHRLLVAALACAALLVPAAVASADVAVFPSPGTPDVSATTQVSFRGIAPSAIGPVTVTGSRSGAHTGHLAPHSDGFGASFLLDKPLKAGETVTVHANLPITGASNGTFTWTVAHALPQGGPLLPEFAGSPSEVLRFRSRPDLAPLRLATKTTGTPQPGYLFFAPKVGPGQDGPSIYDNSGQPIWFHPLGNGDQAYDFRVQTYHGQPVLTWWQGHVYLTGTGVGEGKIVDSQYRTLATVKAGNGYSADLHEFQLTSRGTALVTAYQPVQADDSSVRGGSKNGMVRDSIVQEIDIPTGLVLFEWHSLGHVALSDSFFRPTKGIPWDYFHVNSAAEMPDGSLLVSARNIRAIYDIDRASGQINWTLGGKRSSFKLPSDAVFSFQHDARPGPSGTITMFDNEGTPRIRKESRALTLQLDLANHTASIAGRQFTRSSPLLTANQGSFQPLAGGGAFLGWGNHTPMTEFDANGHTVFEARMPSPDQTYRAFRLAWSAQPRTAPKISVRSHAHGKGATVYVSWNGATNVVTWNLLSGDSKTALHQVLHTAKTGFETALTLQTRPKYAAVQAVDASGRVLATSATERVPGS